VGLRILSDELEALLRDKGLLVRSGSALHSQSGIQGIIIDSAETRGGELFIGLKGQKANGGTFAGSAIERGAALCLVDQAAVESLSSEVLERCVIVLDTLEALWKLAQWWIAGLGLPMVAVTGSVGKTTVKELLAGILVGEGPGFYTQGTENDQIGVPLTLCRADSHHKWGVVEVGTSAPGEMAHLSSLFVAKVAIITCVGEAYLGRFCSRGGVQQEMLDIVKTLKPGGVLIIDGDDHDLFFEAERVAQAFALKLRSFGCERNSEQVSTHQNEVTIKSINSYGLSGIDIRVCFKDKDDSVVKWEDTFQLYLPGLHNGMNVAAVVAAALELFPNLKLEGIKRRFARIRPRVVGIQIVTTSGGVRIFSDCFDSNPKSVHAFLNIAQDEIVLGKSVVLFIGEMADLGEVGLERHREVFHRAISIGALKIVLIGKEFEVQFADYRNQSEEGALSANVHWFGSIEEVFRGVTTLVAGGESGGRLPDLIMVKGSRSSGLEALTDFFIESFGGERLEDASQFMSMDDKV